MTESDTQSPISDHAAMLIERAVRGDLSPEDRAKLDRLAADDPVVATELERAQREEDAMTTAAGLFTQRSDPERMQRAIRQKLDWDRKMIRRIAIGFMIWIPIYLLLFVSEPRNWQLLVAIFTVPMLPVAVLGVLTARRRKAFRRAIEAGDASIADEYSRHLTRSRNENTINRAGWIIACLALTVMLIHDYSSANYGRAILLTICFAVIFFCGCKTVLSRSAQERTDLFFQGRLTLEELFDKKVADDSADHEEREPA